MPKDKLSSLTLKEKATMLSGHTNMTTLPIPEKGVESIILSDGPNGLRIENKDGDSLSNIYKAKPSTCFPVGVTVASTWNTDLINKMGKAMGEEAIHYGINVILGPAVNIQRNPLCGRNFEYLSEDPLLAGKIGAELVKGIQSNGVGACVKHFAGNNNEKYRFVGDSIIDQRALQEIYLKQFEIIVRESNPKAIMTAYNQLNGTFCSENKYLIEDVLRKTWGFDGVVMTDWGGIVHRDIALNHGCDLEMPGMTPYNTKLVYDGVNNGTISEGTLDKSVQRLLDLKQRTYIKEQVPTDFEAHYKLALDIALEGAILLKNDNDLLPLSKDKKYLVVGGLFETMRYQGGGSSLINPMIIKDHKKAFNEYGVNYDFVLGYQESETEVDTKLEDEAVNIAKDYDTIIFFGGLNDYVESEGFDRDDLIIPNNQLSLLSKLTKLGKKVVVVLFNGGPIELPFINDVDSILDMLLPGEAGGEATVKLLFGEACPSGKLSQSWPFSYEDIPFGNEFTSSPYELYKESIFVGYRYYSSVKKEVLFPFGYGLSYTSFKYRDFSVKQDKNGVFARVFVKNTGKVKGKETVQLYVHVPYSKVVRPVIELKGFAKVELEPDQEKEIEIFVPFKYLEVYVNNAFRLEEGEYIFSIGSSCSSIKFISELNIKGEQLERTSYDDIYDDFLKTSKVSNAEFEAVIHRTIPEYKRGLKPYTLETPIGEFKGFFGTIFRKYTCNMGVKMLKKAKKIEDPLLREREKKAALFIINLMENNCLRSLTFSSGDLFSYSQAIGILELCNNHPIRAIKAFKKKYEIKE